MPEEIRSLLTVAQPTVEALTSLLPRDSDEGLVAWFHRASVRGIITQAEAVGLENLYLLARRQVTELVLRAQGR